jgi:hypothetical protein
MAPVDQNESILFFFPTMTYESDARCTEQMVSCVDQTMIASSAIIGVRQSIPLDLLSN